MIKCYRFFCYHGKYESQRLNQQTSSHHYTYPHITTIYHNFAQLIII